MIFCIQDVYKRQKQYIKLPSMITAKDGKFKSYQLGSTYYSALRCSDRAYLIARAVQFYAPGIPPVSYTHLDVYKRQAHNRAREKQGCKRKEQ